MNWDFSKRKVWTARIELIAMLGATKALRDGTADAMIAGSVHDVLTEFPDWRGTKIAVALSQGTPWLLTVRADLKAERGDLHALKGLRITAAQGPDLALKQMLLGAGIDPARDLEIVELPGAKSRDVSFGVFAAHALQAGQIDGFWANAMGGETAVDSGAGKILIDVRRGDDPDEVRFFTFAGMATTDVFIAREPEAVGAAVRAIVKAQKALRADPSLAREVGQRKFPPDAVRIDCQCGRPRRPFLRPGDQRRNDRQNESLCPDDRTPVAAGSLRSDCRRRLSRSLVQRLSQRSSTNATISTAL